MSRNLLTQIGQVWLTFILLLAQLCLATTFLKNGDVTTVEICDLCAGAILDICIIYPSNTVIAFPIVNMTVYINDEIVREEVMIGSIDNCYSFGIPETCKKGHYYYTIVSNTNIYYDDSSESSRLCSVYIVLLLILIIVGLVTLFFVLYCICGLCFCIFKAMTESKTNTLMYSWIQKLMAKFYP